MTRDELVAAPLEGWSGDMVVEVETLDHCSWHGPRYPDVTGVVDSDNGDYVRLTTG